MSYFKDLKDELLRKEDPDHQREWLAGLFLSLSSLFIQDGELKISFQTRDNPVIRKIFNLLKSLFNFQPEIQISEKGDSEKKNYQLILDGEESEILLKELGYPVGLFIQWENFPETLINTDKKRRAFLRGIFIGNGYMTEPKDSYHLEFSSDNEFFLHSLQGILEDYDLNFNLSTRQKRNILYLKNGEKIADFLSLIGAFQSVLKFQDIRALKEINNQINRQMNSDLANMDKTAIASRKQREAIQKIIENNKWNQLNDNLKTMALKRIEFPEESIGKLGELMDPPLSKSGVNYRLNQLLKIASELD